MRREQPWMPNDAYLANLPVDCTVLLGPAGHTHLMLDGTDGQWWHLKQNGDRERVTAGRAAQLRPSDVNLVISATMIWIWRTGLDEARATDLLDELADGIKTMVVTYAERAAQAAQAARRGSVR